MPLDALLATTPKALGAYYTPATLAETLAEWLIRTGQERVLEPSVGEGALLAAAMKRSSSMHGSSMLRALACDINPSAVAAVSERFPSCDCRVVDFLQLDPASTGLFNGIITNPPFTRNHSLSASRRATLKGRFKTTGAAGLWVHFLLHSMDFLLPGGRLAAVVPAAGLFSDYGRAALGRICRHFSKVEVRHFVDQPRWSNDAEERGALLLAEGFGQGQSSLPETGSWSPSASLKPEDHAKADDVVDRLLQHSTPLGAIAKLSIGAVTGCNSVFLLSERERKDLGIELSDVRPVVARARQIPGLSISSETLVSQASDRVWLLAPSSIEGKSSGVRKRLAQISASRRRNTLWFTKRATWWKVDVPECDAIFTYMNDRGPRLVLNPDAVGCTNTLHCVRFSAEVATYRQKAAALTLITSFGQLIAERVGRGYGGGVLKFELKEARQMPCLAFGEGDLDELFEAAHDALLNGEPEVATAMADQALLRPLLGRSWRRSIEQLQSELAARRRIRRGR